MLGGVWLGGQGGTKLLSPLQYVCSGVLGKKHRRHWCWKRYSRICLFLEAESTLLDVSDGSFPSLQPGSGQTQWGTQQLSRGRLCRV